MHFRLKMAVSLVVDIFIKNCFIVALIIRCQNGNCTNTFQSVRNVSNEYLKIIIEIIIASQEASSFYQWLQNPCCLLQTESSALFILHAYFQWEYLNDTMHDFHLL